MENNDSQFKDELDLNLGLGENEHTTIGNIMNLEGSGLYDEEEDDDIDLFEDDSLDGESGADDTGTEIDLADEGLLDIEEEDNTIVRPNNEFLNEDGEISVMDISGDDSDGKGFEYMKIPLDKIAVVSTRIRQSRNVEELCKGIRSTGMLNPIIVAPTKTEGWYVLIHGYRRLLACAKLKRKSIDAIVNYRIKTTEIPILESLYNHGRAYTIKEQISYIDYLEKEKGIAGASMIEYLLQMNSGDYAKLKDIIEDDDADITEKLFDGLYNIQQAFKALESRRKKESREEKDLKAAAKVYANEEETGIDQVKATGETGEDEPEEGSELSDEEIKDIAKGVENLDDVDGDSLDEMVAEGKSVKGFEPHKQDYKNREYLDPLTRKAVLARDNNTCQLCKAISGQEYTEVLDVHHRVEVYLGGNDDIDNLITACTVCHKLVHLYARGELNIRPVEELSEADQSKFKRIVALGNVIRKGMELKGMKREQLKKVDNADTIGRTKPGTPRQVAG